MKGTLMADKTGNAQYSWYAKLHIEINSLIDNIENSDKAKTRDWHNRSSRSSSNF